MQDWPITGGLYWSKRKSKGKESGRQTEDRALSIQLILFPRVTKAECKSHGGLKKAHTEHHSGVSYMKSQPTTPSMHYNF